MVLGRFWLASKCPFWIRVLMTLLKGCFDQEKLVFKVVFIGAELLKLG